MPGGASLARILTIASFALTLAALALLPDRAAAAAGWQVVLDRPTPAFGAVDFVSETEGWMPAGAGLLHTTDGGATWEENAKLTVIDVDFFDQQHGWAVGLSGAIYGTSDGGHHWQLQNSGTGVHLGNVDAVGPQEAWAVGTGVGFSDVILPPPTPSALLHTTDGGASWQSIPPAENVTYRQLAAVGDSVWVLAERCELPPDQSYCNYSPTQDAILLRSRDGGQTWTELALPANVYVNNLTSLTFANDSDGWFVQSGCTYPDCFPTSAIHRTNDGGDTWQTVDTSAYGSIEGFTFEDAQQGWAWAASCPGTGCVHNLLHTDDGGATWFQQSQTARDQGVYGRSLVAHHGTLYLTSSSGEARRSSDGGQSWEDMSTTALELWDITAASPDVAYAAGRNAISRTDDAGETWHRVRSVPGEVRLLGFTDETQGIAVSWDCSYGCLKIWRTADGGGSWREVHSVGPGVSSYPHGLTFAEGGHGVLSLDHGFVITEDGGQTWQEYPLQENAYLNTAADVVDATNAWVFMQCPYADEPCRATNDGGSYGFRHSSDRGRTWQPVVLPEPSWSYTFDFADNQHGWYAAQLCESTCSNTLYATSDGGVSWQPVGDLGQDPPRYLSFTDTLNGWALRTTYDQGVHGEIIHSKNGGRTWTTQVSNDELVAGYAVANGFDFYDANNGWLLLDPTRGKGIGGGPPQRTIVYRWDSEGIGLPDVGTGPLRTSAPLLPLVLSAVAALAFAASFAVRRRTEYQVTTASSPLPLAGEGPGVREVQPYPSTKSPS